MILLLALCEPVLANKFETIGGGLSGSFRLKRQFVESALLYGGIGFIVGSVLAIVIPHSNAAFLNYANWKTSSIVMGVIGVLLLIAYFIY